MEIILISKEEAAKLFNEKKHCLIGYQNKDGGAFYGSSQFPECTDFEAFYKAVKHNIPHSRIKYGKYVE